MEAVKTVWVIQESDEAGNWTDWRMGGEYTTEEDALLGWDQLFVSWRKEARLISRKYNVEESVIDPEAETEPSLLTRIESLEMKYLSQVEQIEVLSDNIRGLNSRVLLLEKKIKK